MNRQEKDIMQILLDNANMNQRMISEMSGHSLGIVNRSINNLIKQGYLNEERIPTEKIKCEINNWKPKNAIILAAGFGMRMIPINKETPKAFLEVKGEILIERLIKQLHEAGIRDIYIVVGFMKEKFEYLIDEYGVQLIVNSEYGIKNNLHSLKLAIEHVSNSYIIPCDVWCAQNPFRVIESYSWYMVQDTITTNSPVRVNRKKELLYSAKTIEGNTMIGISYLAEKEAKIVRQKINQFSEDPKYDDSFWEEVLYSEENMIVSARIMSSEDVVEINTYEQLRELDHNSKQLESKAIDVIAQTLQASRDEILDITVLKKGMTNRSFLFTCKNKKYIMRIPGEGTTQLIDRKKEKEVYQLIGNKNICDHIIYINPENGYKITEFLENARVCDPANDDDVKHCMGKLRELHNLELEVSHEFDLFDQIEFYEGLWKTEESVFKDYRITKENIFSLKDYVNRYAGKKVLTHIDAVPDNFLFVKGEILLIDWEYAGMQDPHVDIAMFCIYSLFDRKRVDWVIDSYFDNKCDKEIRIKIYCYIAICGLLWSNWCEYKRNLGVEFGEYSLRQYRYAKDYFKIVKEMLKD